MRYFWVIAFGFLEPDSGLLKISLDKESYRIVYQVIDL